MLFHLKSVPHRRLSLMGLLALPGLLLFLPLRGLAATPGQLLPKPGNTATQQSEASQATKLPTPSAAPVAEPIPLSDVSKRLETSRRQIRDVSERVQAPEAADIAKELDVTRNTFAEEAKSADSTIAKSLRPEELSDLEAAWKNRAARLAKWQQVISRWTSQLYRDFTLVDQEEQTWELTLKASPPGSLPREVERAVRDLIREIKKVKAEARKRLDSALVLENQLYQRETAISEVLNAVASGRERFQQSLMVAERVPLWEVTTEWQRMGPAAGEIGALLSRQLADAFEFLRTHLLGLGLTVCLFFFILIVAALLSRKVAQWTQDHPHFEAATHFLKRPVSLSLLITLVLSLVFFTDNAPRLVRGLGALLLLIPVLRLLPRLIHPAARPVLFTVAVFYIFDSVLSLFLAVPLVDRLAFLVLDIVAFIVLIWLVRLARVRQLSTENATPAYLIFLFRVALFLVCVSLVANILGYFDLAKLLSTGILYSAYAMFTIFGTTKALSIIFAVLLDTDLARSLSVVRRYGGIISHWGFRILNFAAFVLSVGAILRFFTVRDNVVKAVTDFLTAPIRQGRVDFSLWDVIAFGLVLAAAIMISRAVRLILEEDVFSRVRLARGVPDMISTTVYYTLLLLGFFLALGMAGIDLNRFTLLAGAFGVGVGFGLQNIVNNFISGLILMFERPIHPGDTIEVGGVSGIVKSIGIRSSTISTGDGADAIIPNATLISEKLLNWTLTNPWRRIDIKVGVAYGSDLQKAMEILLAVAAADSNVLKDPTPAVAFQGFGESAINFELRVWTLVQANLDTKSRLSLALAQALSEAGIEIPFPQRDLNLKSVDKQIKELLSRGDHEPRKTE
jgi:potassium-dependent mechanosensitive channel